MSELQSLDLNDLDYAINRIQYYNEMPSKAVLLKFLNELNDNHLLTESEAEDMCYEREKDATKEAIKDVIWRLDEVLQRVSTQTLEQRIEALKADLEYLAGE